MADSSSTNFAQVQKLCDLCETAQDIKWRCVQCNVFMCNKCKNIHLKVQTSIQHEILDLKTSFSEFSQKISTDDILCMKHKRICCLFCGSCEIMVCPDCISSSHYSHDFEPIENVISEKADELKRFEANIQTDLSRCQKRNSDVQTAEAKFNSLFDESIAKIQIHEQHLKDAISKYSIQLQDEIEIERIRIAESLSQIKKNIQQSEKNLIAEKNKIKETLILNQGKVIFEAAAELKYTSSVSFGLFPIEAKQFIPGDDTSNMHGIFGNLRISKMPQPDTDFEVVRELNPDLFHINKLICVDKTSAWISCSIEDVVRKINFEENKHKTVQNTPIKVYDMALSPDNKILLSLYNSSDIKLLTEKGKENASSQYRH